MCNVPAMYSRKAGFTLIEMSIVLLIIGLLTGAIVAGKTLVDNAELRAMQTDAEKYITAVKQFQDIYETLPGDMYYATDVWGIAAATTACDTTDNNDLTTCNGDGDGRIEYNTVVTGPTFTSNTESNEMFRVWQHLYNAELIEMRLTGLAGADANDATIGTNVPEGTRNGGYTLFYMDASTSASYYDNQKTGHILVYGLDTADETLGEIMSVEEAYSIDKKADDGFPETGNITTEQFLAVTYEDCVTDASPDTYDLSNTDGRSCNLIFYTGF